MRLTGILRIARSARGRRGRAGVLAAPAALLGVLVFGAAAAASAPVPAWSIDSFALPSVFSSNDNVQCTANFFGCDAYRVTVVDAGAEAADGSPITITDTLPAGVTAKHVTFRWLDLPNELGGEQLDLGSRCTAGLVVQCRLGTAEEGWPPVEPDGRLEMTVSVAGEPGLSGALTNTVTVSGGGAATASKSVQNQTGAPPPAFGVAGFTAPITGLDATPYTQAGGHPYEFSTRVDLNNVYRISPESEVGVSNEPISVHDVKDVVVDLPLGFLGSALAAPRCTFAQLASEPSYTTNGCPPGTRIGHIRTEPTSVATPNGFIYNMVPERGVAAEFAYLDGIHTTHALYASVVPTPRGYVLRTTAPDLPQVSLGDIIATFYGDPAARNTPAGAQVPTGDQQIPFFTNPSDCTGESLVTSVHLDSWQNPGRLSADGTPDFGDPNWASASYESPPVSGCNLLQFDPELSAQPETTVADSPTGLNVELAVPQDELMETLGTPPLRDATVTLPAGLTINPSAATGLGACTEAQIGLGSAALPSCPESSKIGTLEVSTPALAGTLQGSIYLATQNENPFHTLLAGYIVIDDPTTGVVVKIPGSLTPDPVTGQITGVFKENPQFPFGDLKLHFFGGSRGDLATPTGCGTYTTTSDLMPWSAPDSGPDATPFDSFPIDTGCVTGFAPSFTAGTENPQAGGYSPFTLSLSRSDGDQNLAGVSVMLPPGLLGKIAGIPLCPDANANAGTCPEASLIGSVQAGAGVGPNPLFVGGKAYLTGPYNGGPYGIVVEVPAVAGPFNLGTVVVRQSLRIDPHTAQVTDVSDPFPTILDGIPLRVRRIDVTLDRPGFTFNPTSCTPMTIGGTVTSTQGASAQVSSRFQAGGCRELPFKPSFTVSTQARTSKKNGASLDVKVGYPQGKQANIRSVAVTLPKALPSRLTTIQQACPEATFNQNPASCPAGSNIGIATAHTPVLAGPVVGPAYLVSHGGAAFPDLVLILQGEGVKLELVGSINIKKGVTSSAFNAVPDAPISSFELKLPEGPHSGLAAVLPAKAKGSLCGTSLTMPTTITGQNGAVVRQSTKIAVTGCPKAKKKTHKAKHPKKHRTARKGKRKG